MLQVAMGGEVISSSVVFEYKARDLPALPSSQHDWLSLDGESTYLCFFFFERTVLHRCSLGVWCYLFNKEHKP